MSVPCTTQKRRSEEIEFSVIYKYRKRGTKFRVHYAFGIVTFPQQVRLEIEPWAMARKTQISRSTNTEASPHHMACPAANDPLTTPHGYLTWRWHQDREIGKCVHAQRVKGDVKVVVHIRLMDELAELGVNGFPFLPSRTDQKGLHRMVKRLMDHEISFGSES